MRVIHVDAVGETAGRTTRDSFRLHGLKGLMHTLTKNYNGHTLEISGTLNDPANSQGSGQGTELGKNTRVYAGPREISDVPSVIEPSIEVSSFRDVAGTCTSTGGDLLPN
ncbi:MAG: hypothetical protein ACRD1V_15690 [Vicinamibacterales bacterium]